MDESEPPVRTFQANSLADFTEWVTLRTDMDTMSDDGAAVTLMTIHSAKGLEFDCVFVAGMEESSFSRMAILLRIRKGSKKSVVFVMLLSLVLANVCI